MSPPFPLPAVFPPGRRSRSPSPPPPPFPEFGSEKHGIDAFTPCICDPNSLRDWGDAGSWSRGVGSGQAGGGWQNGAVTELPAPLAELEAFFAQLSREPDFDAPELQAYDAADLLLLQTALEWHDPAGRACRDQGAVADHLDKLDDRSGVSPDPVSGSARFAKNGAVVTIGDRHGALTLGAAKLLGATGIKVHQDPVLFERALAANAERLGLGDDPTSVFTHHPLGEQLLIGAKLVLLQLPKSLAELEEISHSVARYADPDVVLLAGGRDKHMSRGMNELLARHFEDVSAGLGWRKARVLTARSPKTAAVLGAAPFPRFAGDPDLRFQMAAFGATFGGATLDHGSRLLLRTLREQLPAAAPKRVVDIGCGNGVLAVSAALEWPEAQVIASDQSLAAVRATLLTAQRAGVDGRVAVHRADATEAVPDGWADLVLLNPPFHTGSTVHVGVGQRLIRACARALAPGGELLLVFNTHLGYRQLVEREIGPTRQLARDRTFTVLAATRR